MLVPTKPSITYPELPIDGSPRIPSLLSLLDTKLASPWINGPESPSLKKRPQQQVPLLRSNTSIVFHHSHHVPTVDMELFYLTYSYMLMSMLSPLL